MVRPEPHALRERRRVRTKLMVQAEAMRLFATKGYEQTTVDDITDAAAMSPRTFFRYFPTKEDVALWDEYDEQPLAETLAQQPGRDPLVRLVCAVRGIMEAVYDRDRDLQLARAKLVFTVPELRARFLVQQIDTVGLIYEELAAALDADPNDLGLRVMLGAMYAALVIAVERWQRDDGRQDLSDLIDGALGALTVERPELHAALAAASTVKREELK
jgi:AcrR family transcriptional regulator